MENTIKKNLLVAFVSSMMIMSSCEKNETVAVPGDPVNITIEAYQQEVIDSANRFAFDLFKPLLSDGKGTENIMISPFSISSALSMTLNGASGETFEAIRKTLKQEQKNLEEINSTYLKLMTEMVPVDKRVIVEIANSVWVEKRLIVKQPFINSLQSWYKAEARDIDVTNPKAVGIVNGWIAEKTHDKITDMLEELDDVQDVYHNVKSE